MSDVAWAVLHLRHVERLCASSTAAAYVAESLERVVVLSAVGRNEDALRVPVRTVGEAARHAATRHRRTVAEREVFERIVRHVQRVQSRARWTRRYEKLTSMRTSAFASGVYAAACWVRGSRSSSPSALTTRVGSVSTT